MKLGWCHLSSVNRSKQNRLSMDSVGLLMKERKKAALTDNQEHLSPLRIPEAGL